MKPLVVCLMLVAGTAGATPDTSPRPEPRPGGAQTFHDTAVAGARPQVSASVFPGTVLRPQIRPRSLESAAERKARLSALGAVCGDPAILGEPAGSIRSGVTGCGIPEAVRVRSVAGVSLSPSALMECNTARTLRHWVEVSAIPRVAAEGGAALVNLRIVGHYACRPRNNRTGARISEHGKGRAIDISEFRLRDGSVISVARDWDTPRGFRALREMHRDACGIFKTVLGPKADRFHEDHFHLDTAQRSGGTYCR